MISLEQKQKGTRRTALTDKRNNVTFCRLSSGNKFYFTSAGAYVKGNQNNTTVLLPFVTPQKALL